ncbi:hypothetical protein A9Q84_09605 [Halobacteriovorax marinus]|uniref:Uncharacterized protein n=1 Tax=Halobacteriovorax marinus TaxID=97084 RepID=A0A1Y5FD97_9BACT|nr:hypothetical protein A9Q84_09605 [Halobacteriovorax marinus]
MKTLLSMLTILFSYSAIAGISLDIDFKNNESGKEILFKKKVETFLDETRTFTIPNSKNILEVRVTDRIPEVLLNGEKGENQVLISMKVIELIDGKRKVIASPTVVSLLGEEASFNTYEGEDMKSPIMSLKLIPSRIK